jgi:hypothetical protein
MGFMNLSVSLHFSHVAADASREREIGRMQSSIMRWSLLWVVQNSNEMPKVGMVYLGKDAEW